MKIHRCRLPREKQRRLLEMFVAQVTARTAAALVGVHRNTAALFYRKLRMTIASHTEHATPERAVFECDESYFGGARKGVRGRGALGKVCVFGVLKRNGSVWTLPVANASSKTLLDALRKRASPDSVVFTDAMSSYDALSAAGFQHRRVNHSVTFVDQHGSHTNGIENFWRQAKRVLARYNGVPRKYFALFLKECEFRFNCGSPIAQLATLREWARV